jgi:hypothetical protein
LHGDCLIVFFSLEVGVSKLIPVCELPPFSGLFTGALVSTVALGIVELYVGFFDHLFQTGLLTNFSYP